MDTTRQRREEVFRVYSEEVKKVHQQDPELAKSLSKSYFYRKVGSRCGYVPTHVGLIVQQKLQEKGLKKRADIKNKRGKRRKAIAEEVWDEEIRFLLSLDD